MKHAGQTKPSSTVSDGGAAGGLGEICRPSNLWLYTSAVGASFRLDFELVLSFAPGDTPDAFLSRESTSAVTFIDCSL